MQDEIRPGGAAPEPAEGQEAIDGEIDVRGI